MDSMNSTHKIGSCEKGAAFLETALVLPILTMLIFGIIQFGWILAAYINLRNATAVAARYAVLYPAPTVQNIRDVAKGAVEPMLDSARVQDPVDVDQSYSVGGIGSATKVEITYDLPLFIPLPIPGVVNGNYQMTVSTVMR